MSSVIGPDLSFFFQAHVLGTPLNLKDPSIDLRIQKIASNLNFLKKEDLAKLGRSVQLEIFTAALQKDGLSERIKTLLPPALFAELLKQLPTELKTQMALLALEADGDKLKLRYNARLSASQIEELLAAFPGKEKILQLDLSGSKNLFDLTCLKSLPNLEVLYLNECSALKNLAGLQMLPKLRELELKSCSQLKTLEALENCPDLESLDLTNCSGLETLAQETDGVRKGLSSLPHLKKLSLSKCTFVLSPQFAALETLSGLEELDLSHLPLINEIAFLGAFKQLKKLNLAYTSISDASALNHLP
ncbi:MAG: hypothetical protein WC371_00300, partial [Parachlamydiales bacterium]